MPLHCAFFAGGPGPGELILIFLVILVLFGPKRLPEIARMIGKALDDLRKASQDFRDQIMRIEKSRPIDIRSQEVRETEPESHAEPPEKVCGEAEDRAASVDTGGTVEPNETESKNDFAE